MSLRIERRGRVAVLTLDRPEVRNAFDERLIAELTRAYEAAGRDPEVRAVLLAAAGSAFSAGGDLAWMRRMATASQAENLDDARRLAALLRAVDTCPKPTLARVQGPAFAGGLGLVACSDIAVAAREAAFAVPELRLGLIPAAIGPYVVRAVGARAARRLFLSGETIGAEEALRLGLVHEVTAADALDAAVERRLAAVLAAGPEAAAATKRLVADIAPPIDDSTIDLTARRLAATRSGAEAAEGIAAFFDKRKPGWAP